MNSFAGLVNTVVRICSVDPGTATLGFSILDVDLISGNVSVVHAETLKSTKEIDKDHVFVETQGARAAKLAYYRWRLFRLLHAYNPSMLIAEAPYMGRFANSYAALVEVRKIIQHTVMEYNPGLFFETIEPLNVKMAVGIKLTKENRKDKNAVRKAIALLPNVVWLNGITLEQCDEHTVDAIAVGYWKAMQMFNALQFS